TGVPRRAAAGRRESARCRRHRRRPRPAAGRSARAPRSGRRSRNRTSRWAVRRSLGPKIGCSVMTLEYWHNPRCSKSRAGKELLDAAGAAYTERRYVDDAPTAAEFDQVLTALGKEPWDIARMGEDIAKELDLK